jgi:hypothetical protein
MLTLSKVDCIERLYEDFDMDSSNNPEIKTVFKGRSCWAYMKLFPKDSMFFEYSKAIFYLTFYEVMFYPRASKV